MSLNKHTLFLEDGCLADITCSDETYRRIKAQLDKYSPPWEPKLEDCLYHQLRTATTVTTDNNICKLCGTGFCRYPMETLIARNV